MAHFPIPPGADATSKKAFEHFEKKFHGLTLPEAEIQFIINGIMKAQVPRDEERARKEQEKRKAQADRMRKMAEVRRRRF
jgi:hypothetical protein